MRKLRPERIRPLPRLSMDKGLGPPDVEQVL